MHIYSETKDPTETRDFTFDWAPRLETGEKIASQAVVFIEAAGTTNPTESHDDTTSRVWLSGGNAGSRAVWTIAVTTDSTPPRVLEEAFALDIVDSVDGPAAETDVERYTRYLSEAEAALHQLATGTQVVDLWHDGRRRRYIQQNTNSLTAYIDWLKRQIDAATDAETGRPRRRAIRLGWKN